MFIKVHSSIFQFYLFILWLSDYIWPYFAFCLKATTCIEQSGQNQFLVTSFDHVTAALLVGQRLIRLLVFDQSNLSIRLHIS